MFYFSHEKTKTMVEIHKFVFSMIQFISLFLITIEVGRCKSCFHPFQIFFFALQFINNFLLSSFSNIILLYLFITVRYGCETDADCPRYTHNNFSLKCINNKCEWSAKFHQFSEHQIKENEQNSLYRRMSYHVSKANMHYMLCSNITRVVIYLLM